MARYAVIMQPTISKVICIIALTMLTACGAADNDPGAGGVSSSDAEALDKAAQKLDERDKAAEAEE
jgi:hypothetical protein